MANNFGDHSEGSPPNTAETTPQQWLPSEVRPLRICYHGMARPGLLMPLSSLSIALRETKLARSRGMRDLGALVGGAHLRSSQSPPLAPSFFLPLMLEVSQFQPSSAPMELGELLTAHSLRIMVHVLHRQPPGCLTETAIGECPPQINHQ